MELEVKEGSHGKLVLRGYLFDRNLETFPAEGIIRVTSKSEDVCGYEEVLFCGIIQEAYVFFENGVRQVILMAATCDIKMDRMKSNRSFQNTSETYTGIIQKIASKYQGEIVCDNPSLRIGKPMLQYEETDWEFSRRVASYMGLGIFCNPVSVYPQIMIGLAEGGRKATFSEESYQCCVDEQYYERGKNHPKSELIHYQVESTENYAIGDGACYKGQKRYIFEKKAELRKGILIFRYKLGGKCHFMKPKQYNRKIAGLSLPGKIEKTDKESVYIKLDIDGDGGNASNPYPWAPITDNLMYCMPQLGTRAYLYFPDCHEQ